MIDKILPAKTINGDVFIEMGCNIAAYLGHKGICRFVCERMIGVIQ